MLISSHIQLLLGQFQTQYPMGCLCSELLTIHQGQYIVRSIVQSAGMTLATAMAAAPDIEAAEDRAKTRVLETIGLTLPAAMPLPAPSLPQANLDPKSSWPELKPNAVQSPHPLPINSGTPQPNHYSFKQPVPTTDNSPNENSVSKVDQSPTAAVDRAQVPPQPPSHLPATSEEGSLSTEARDRLAFHAEGVTAPTSTAAKARSASSLDTSSLDASSLTNATTSTSPTTGSLTTTMVESVMESSTVVETPKPAAKAEKVSKRKDSSESHPTPTPSSQELGDRSEEIMKIGIEMKRLGWSMEQGREYLKRTYGKRSRQELDDAELLDFLHYLEMQLSPLQTPF